MPRPRPHLLLLLALRAGGAVEPDLPECEQPAEAELPSPEPPRSSWRPRLLSAASAGSTGSTDSACAGAVVLIDEEGEPFDTVPFSINDQVWLTTNELGSAEWVDRPCGPQSVAVRMNDTRFEFEDVEVTNNDDLMLVWPAEDFAVVRLVGPDCQPWPDGPVRPVSVSSIEPLGGGRYRLWSVEPEVTLTVRYEGSESLFEVPINGSEHRLAIPEAREVEVVAMCPPAGCGAIWCSWDLCKEPENGIVRCACPAEGAALRPTGTSGPNRPVPDGATRIQVDLREGGDFSGELLDDPWPVLEWGAAPARCLEDVDPAEGQHEPEPNTTLDTATSPEPDPAE